MSVDEQIIASLQAEITTLRTQIAEQSKQLTQNHIYARLIEVSPDLLVAIGADGYVKLSNPSWEQALGYKPGDLKAKPFVEFIHPDDRERTQARLATFAQDGTKTLSFDNRYQDRSGEYRWLRWTAIKDETSDLIYSTGHDITDEKILLAQIKSYVEIFEKMPVALFVYELEDLNDPKTFRLKGANPTGSAVLGIPEEEQAGKLLYESSPGLYKTNIPDIYAEIVRTGTAIPIGEFTYNDDGVQDAIFSLMAFPLPNHSLGVIFEDLTEQKRSENALQQLRIQEEIINAQSLTLAELTTPLLTISDTTVVMPLVGTIDTKRAQQVLDVLLQGVADSHAQIAILDITGVPVVDTQVANALIRAAQAVSLLGAKVILTGIRAEVAQTLIGLGVDLSMITTQSNLQRGIAYALNAIKTDR